MHMHIKILGLNKNKLSLQMDMKELKLRAGRSERVNTHTNVSAGTDVVSTKRILGFAPGCITKNVVKGGNDKNKNLEQQLSSFQPHLALPCPRPTRCARCARIQCA